MNTLLLMCQQYLLVSAFVGVSNACAAKLSYSGNNFLLNFMFLQLGMEFCVSAVVARSAKSNQNTCRQKYVMPTKLVGSELNLQRII